MFESLQEMLDFQSTGIYDILVGWASYFVTQATIGLIKFKIFMASFAWDIGKNILETFDISGKINSALGDQPSDIQNLLYFFRLPEFLTNLFAGFAGRWALRFMPVF